MREFFAALFAGFAVLTTGLGIAQHTTTDVSSLLRPVVIVDLARIGWAPPPNVSDREYFKDFTLGKLASMDQNTKVVFLDESVILVYHTKQEGKDWRTASRFIEAFFIRARDGSLIAAKKWASSPRKALDDLVDSEARLIPLNDGRFLVFANATIRVYSPTIELLKEQKLESSASSLDLWSAQSIVGGKWIFLQHESPHHGVQYSWLATDSLEVKYQAFGYQGRYDAIGGAVANADYAIERSRAGVRTIDREQRIKNICDDPFCRESGSLRVLSPLYLGWSGMSGIGIIDADRGGLVWSKFVQPRYLYKAFEFGEMRSAMSGTKFAVWVTANKKASFDGVEINPITILVYDLASLNDRPLVFRLKPLRPDWDFALSPSGTKLALFDGASVRIYACGVGSNE